MKNPKEIRDLIQSEAVKSQLAMVLPKHLTADRMARVACTAILKTPKLAACRPESLLQGLMLCSQVGLEPDGRNAHLIPYGDQVQVIFDWKGLVALARRNGIRGIAAEVVCEHDQFNWWRDQEGLHCDHKINWRKPRGEMFAAYCTWTDGGEFDGEVMSKDEIDGIRKRSKASASGPWVTDYLEMAKKTVIRRASKRWPLDTETADSFNKDDDVPGVTVQPPAMPSFGELPPAETLEQFCVANGFTFGNVVSLMQELGVKDCDSFASFAEIPQSVQQGMMSDTNKLKEQLNKVKG